MLADPQVVLAGPWVTQRPTLDATQQAVVAAESGAQLVLGPAGSGKTTALLTALAAHIEQGRPRSAAVGIVPTASAARRWRSVLTGWTGREAPRVSTLHSLALRLVQDDAEERGGQAPQLLSASDQLAVVADVLAGSRPAQWPALYREALDTRHFAERVRDFIARAALAGWTPARLGAVQEPEVWPAIAAVWRRYRRVLALSGAIDYADLLDRATRLARRERHVAPLLVCVDDYADLDPRQLALLAALVDPGTRLVATADPDLVADRFRGAAERSADEFADLFPAAAPPVVLTGSYRFGDAVEAARRNLGASLPLAGLPGDVVRSYRGERTCGHRSSLEVLTYRDGFAEAAGVAGLLRRYALEQVAEGGAPRWRDAAVLARSQQQLADLEYALTASGIPVEVEGSGRRLADEPLVQLLVTGLALACRAAAVPAPEPAPERIMDLVLSPAGGADPVELRRLILALRRSVQPDGGTAALRPAPGEILGQALLHPAGLVDIDPRRYPAVRAAGRLQRRIAAAAEQVARGDGAAEVLWTLWSDTPAGPGRWAQHLRGTALRGGPAAGAAHRSLDAALALFAEARRSPARGGRLLVPELLAALPGLPWPAGGSVPDAGRVRNAVSLLTPHRARGREWRLVVVAGVQEGSWPRESGGLGLLGEELLEPQGSVRGVRQAQVAAERRLFALACTRASDHLVVTAVASPPHDPGGPQPSRFLADLAVAPISAEPVSGLAPTPIELVARLRRACTDADAPPAVRTAATARLAALRSDEDFPWADPDRWWGIAERTVGTAPILPPGEPVTLSVTGLAELAECPRRWFLTRMLRASRPSDTATGIGRLVHRIHEAWINAEIDRDLSAAEDVVDRVWGSLPFDASWYGRRRRAEVMSALVRLLAWQEDNLDRIAFAERPFEVEAELPDGMKIRLRGKADVGVRHSDGSLAVLDVKTAKSAPTRAEVARHVQLAGYQWAVRQGGLAEHGGETDTAGAALLMASVPDRAGGTRPKVLWQPPLGTGDPDDAWFTETLVTAAARLRAEEFPPLPSSACRTCSVSLLCPVRNPAQGVAP